jgi:hypothetical protein
MMNKDLLIRLFVPTKSAGGPGNAGKCGTGFPIGRDPGQTDRDLILTCHHVIFPRDEASGEMVRDADKPIEILWQGDKSQVWHLLDVDPVVWFDEGLDVAVLSGPRADMLSGYGAVSGALPMTGERWESGGFASAAKFAGERRLASFKGEMYSQSRTDLFFEIGVDQPPERQQDWGGASGMPVCRLGTDVVMGVAGAVPSGWNNERLKVAPCFRLLQDNTFLIKTGNAMPGGMKSRGNSGLCWDRPGLRSMLSADIPRSVPARLCRATGVLTSRPTFWLIIRGLTRFSSRYTGRTAGSAPSRPVPTAPEPMESGARCWRRRSCSRHICATTA